MNTSFLIFALQFASNIDPVLENSIRKVKENYLKGNLTAIFKSSHFFDTQPLVWITKEIANSGPVILFDIENTTPHLYYTCLKKPKNIVIISDQEDIANFTKKLKEHYFWDSTCQILLITKERIHKWLSELWLNTNAANVAALLITKGDQFYTWRPFKPDECSNVNNIEKIPENELFTYQLPSNFGKCVLVIVTSNIYPLVLSFEDSTCTSCGVELNVAKAFIEKYNFVGNFTTTPSDVFFWDTIQDGNPKGALEMIYNSKCDMIFGGLQRRWEYFRFASQCVSILEDYLSFFVPVPDVIPNIRKLQMAFHLKYWIFIIISFGLIVFTYIMSVFITKESIMGGIIKSWSVFLYSPIIMPKNKGLRILIMMTYVYSLHITTGFQSSMIFMLSRELLEPPITFIEQALEKNLIFNFYEYHRPIITNDYSDLWKKITEKHLQNFDVYPDYDSFVTQKSGVLLGPKAPTPFYVKMAGYIDKYDRIMLMPLQIPYMVTSNVMMTPRGHPIQKLIDLTNQQLVESGIPDFWFKAFKEFDGHVDPHRNVPLSIDSLLAAFCLLGGFLVLSLISFVCELIYSGTKYKCNKKPINECEILRKKRRALMY